MAIERILNPELKGMEMDNEVEETVRVKVEPGVENSANTEVLQYQPAKYPESKELTTNGFKDPNPESSTITIDTTKHPSTPPKLPRPATTPRPKTAPTSPTTSPTTSSTISPSRLHINSKIYIYLHANIARNRLHITEPQHQLLRQLATRTVRALNITSKGKCPPEVWAQYENTVKASPLLDAVRAQLEGELTWSNLEVREAWMWLLVRCLNSVQGSERVRRKEGEEGGRERRRRKKREYYPEFDEELLALLKPAALEKAEKETTDATDATPGKRKREDQSTSPAWASVNKSAPGSGFSKFKLETPVTASPQLAPTTVTTSTTTPKSKKKSPSSSSAIKRRRFTSPPSMNLNLHTMSSSTATATSSSEAEPNSSSRQSGVITISTQEYKEIVKEQFERLRQEIPEKLGEAHRVAVMERFMEIAEALRGLVEREEGEEGDEGDEGERVKVEEVLRLLVMMGRAAFVVEEEREEKEEKEAN